VRIDSFSPKQLTALTWWCDSSPYREREAIICDGAVRSGKTMCMGLSFICWAMRRFDGQQFGICGKTIVSVRRNLLGSLLPMLGSLGFRYREKISQNRLEVSCSGRSNTFYLFGGKDESSQALIQGITLAGALMDEAAIMPRSFVEQACARCSVEGSRLWFNCNPEGPEHWFFREWIQKAEERRALYLHFTMADNPSLSESTLERYRRMYTGVFYRRFVLGEWIAAQGRIYDFFDGSMAVKRPEEPLEEYAISCDYGTMNPSSFGLWGRREGAWYRLEEFYHDSRRMGRQLTDAEYAEQLEKLRGGRELTAVVADPSAASFIELLRRKGLPVVKADNDVLQGIRITADMLKSGRLAICEGCTDAIREFGLYCWNDRAQGRDEPLKVNDHAMDEIRYFAVFISGQNLSERFAATWVERQAADR